MLHHQEISDRQVYHFIRRGFICFAGNRLLNIFGTLYCRSGKRMKRENRVFFSSVKEALHHGFRPCGHCMQKEYKLWKMDLFGNTRDITKNLLPQDGTVQYYGKILPPQQADDYLKKLLQGIEWRNDEAIIFGKKIITSRKVAWYGDQPFEYTYSNVSKYALPWNDELLELKTLTEKSTGETFNSCLLNLYHNGTEGMAWHSDGEKDLKKHGAIASLSFGAERKFAFKHKRDKSTVSLHLEHGSLLVMKGATQDHWLHRLPPATKISAPRVNLTFRTIVAPDI